MVPTICHRILVLCLVTQNLRADDCETRNARICEKPKKIYVMGAIGVGKSTCNNVLSGQSALTGCFKTGNSIKAVTKTTYDMGCHNLLGNSALNTQVIMVDTPGLNDVGAGDLSNLATMEKYHKVHNAKLPTTAFTILLDGRNDRLSKPFEDMLEHLVRSFGPNFWNHVIFVYARMPFTDDNIWEVWDPADEKARSEGKDPIYGIDDNNVLVAHRRRWGTAFNKLAADLTSRWFSIEEENSSEAIEIPDLRDHMVYLDIGHIIKKEVKEKKTKECAELSKSRSQDRRSKLRCKKHKRHGGYDKYLENNPEIEPQFKQATARYVALLNKLSKTPFSEEMLSAEDRRKAFEKEQCKSVDFKRWDDDAGACVWNTCTCTHGDPVPSGECPLHDLEACQSCPPIAHFVDPRTFVFGTKSKIYQRCVLNVCRCSHGTVVPTGKCPSHGLEACEKCASSGHFEKPRAFIVSSGTSKVFQLCRKNVCQCSNGTPKTGSACRHGRHMCQSCSRAYQLAGNNCIYKRCHCHGGTGCSGSSCPHNGAHHCCGCDKGWIRKKYTPDHCKKHNLYKYLGIKGWG